MDSTSRPSLFQRYMNGSLVLQIIIGIVCGIAIASFSPSAAQSAGLLGNLFVKALKAIAPLLVFVLVTELVCGCRGCRLVECVSCLLLKIRSCFLFIFFVFVWSMVL